MDLDIQIFVVLEVYLLCNYLSSILSIFFLAFCDPQLYISALRV